MSEFDHFVITRFNVRTQEGQNHASAQWLEDRFKLFELYCWPSMLAQSNLNFSWLLFIDSSTPAWLEERIKLLSLEASFRVDLIIVPGVFDADVVRSTLRDRRSNSLTVSTRLDNDDMVALDFIETIQNNIRNRKFLLINLIDGSQVADGLPYRRPYPANPFITLVENTPIDDHLTVFATEHPLMPALGPVLNIRTTHPIWMQVVHEANIANEIVGLPMSARSLRRWFPAADLKAWPPHLYLAVVLLSSVKITYRILRQPRRVWALIEVLKSRRTKH